MRDSIYHHCFATPKWKHTNGHIDIQYTLCGLEAYNPLWCSWPTRFLANTGEGSEPPMCPYCRNHPDLALMLLGEV